LLSYFINLIINLIIKYGIEKIIQKYEGDKWVKEYNTKSHPTVMLYGEIRGERFIKRYSKWVKDG